MEKGHHHKSIFKKNLIIIHLPPKDTQPQSQEIDVKGGSQTVSHNYTRGWGEVLDFGPTHLGCGASTHLEVLDFGPTHLGCRAMTLPPSPLPY